MADKPKTKLDPEAQAALDELKATHNAEENEGRPAPWSQDAPWEEFNGDGQGGQDLAPGSGGVLFTVTEGRDLKSHQATDGPAMAKPVDLREDAFASDTEGPGASRIIYSQTGPGRFLLPEQSKLVAMEESIRMYREDPSYRGIVDAFVFYTIGNGVKVRARDEDPAVQEYIDRFSKASGMDGKDSEMVRRYMLTGEVCVRLFLKGLAAAGKPVDAKLPVLRLIPFWRLRSIKRDSQDPERYESFSIYKVDLSAENAESVSLKADQVDQDVPVDEVIFYKNAHAEELRGEPPLLVIMRACRWYADWIKNRVVLNRYRTSFVLFKKVTGPPGRVTSTQAATPDATKTGKAGKVEKRMPKPGTMVTHNQNIEYDWKSPNLGAMDAKEDGHHIRMHICAGAQVPEFVMGDSGASNFASVFVAENPFIRKVEFNRDLFTQIFREVYARVIAHGIKVGELSGTSSETAVDESKGVVGFAKRAAARLGLVGKLNEKGELVKKQPVATKTEVDLEWPPLLHKNMYEEAQTYQIHQAMGLASIETIRGLTGYDHEVEEQRMTDEDRQAQDAFDKARQDEIDGGDNPDDTGDGKKDKTANGGKGE